MASALPSLLQNPSSRAGVLGARAARSSPRTRQGSKLHLSALLRWFSSRGHEKFLNEIMSPSALLISAYASEDFCKRRGCCLEGMMLLGLRCSRCPVVGQWGTNCPFPTVRTKRFLLSS